jgi:hypothetical protein
MMRFFNVLVLFQAFFLSSPVATVDAFQTRVVTTPSVGHFTTTQAQAPVSIAASASISASISRLSMAADPESGKPKESFVDRLTGPKLFKTVTNWNGIHSVPLVPLRILTGLLMIHHGSEGACMRRLLFPLIPIPIPISFLVCLFV